MARNIKQQRQEKKTMVRRKARNTKSWRVLPKIHGEWRECKITAARKKIMVAGKKKKRQKESQELQKNGGCQKVKLWQGEWQKI
jgi:hypothetical protein